MATPAAFIGHGSPTNALEHNRFTEAWAAFGADLPPLRGVVAVSAHWYVDATAVTAMAQPRTIHDFYGFGPELFAVQYPAPGDPALAAVVADALAPAAVHLDDHQWGLDHGTWSVLVHVLPAADVPVVQLSIDATATLADHIELGRRLEPLRHQGVAVVASGNVVHNLGRIDWSAPGSGAPWAQRFDDTVRHIMATEPARLTEVADHPDYAAAVPTPDHFLPLAYLAGMADAAGATPRVLVDGCTLGSLSMTSYVLD